ncbi:hypothetical protein RirG_027380 [Rhizophagus irregularis DAOM 197198w]|uniref:Uncharacterized protein n=1 Tax=Rhizophagus irregularis (strain DAOM 197198w) TaxID=1432141 RepID=A0A015K5J4_RHIIW|nr:hypothetical protein RirG_027380 [Rhizophagus irregularis DAOM 197198w]
MGTVIPQDEEHAGRGCAAPRDQPATASGRCAAQGLAGRLRDEPRLSGARYRARAWLPWPAHQAHAGRRC